MWGTSTLRTLANDNLATLAKNDPLTGCEPSDLHISEIADIFIQESSSDGHPLSLHDLEFDDYTIGMGPVADQFDSLIPNVRENPCRGSENERIRILLERQREQILADCQAEIRKHEFQAD